MNKMLLAMILAAVALLAAVEIAIAQQKPQFQLGFKDLADLIPNIVGEPLENERYDPMSGDFLQTSTGGLLVWKKAANITAFTDGARTWVNGPNGLEERSNDERFGWETALLEAASETGTDAPGTGSQAIPVSTGDLSTQRPATGSILQDSDRDGLGELTIENGLDLDAIAVLASQTSQPLVSVYIRSAESYILKGIRDGVYLLFFSMGEDWNAEVSNFSQPQGFRFDKSLSFETAHIQEGTRYSVKRVSLHSEPGGSVPVVPVSPEQFPPIRNPH